MKKVDAIYLRVLSTLFSLVLLVFVCSAQEKDNKDNVDLQTLVKSKKFMFTARSATAVGGRLIQLTSSYDVKLSNDSLIVDLPYFGRAYTAPIDPSQGGFRFTSTDFAYTVQEKRKGGWDIMIKPKDSRDVRQISLSVSLGGYASLQVVSNNRQAISYYGDLSANKSLGM